jgi:putative membrane protein
MTDTPAINVTNELAKERNRAAAARTLMAWIRTSLALIGFGFGIDRIVDKITALSHAHSTGLTAFVSLSLMALGVYGLIAASLSYRQELRWLAEGRYEYQTRTSHTLIVAGILSVIGAVAFIGVVIQLLT